jgi:Fic family protein
MLGGKKMLWKKYDLKKENMTKTELDFLKESNNIEDEWDDVALQDAILAWEYLKKNKKLTISIILETHRILMEHRDLPDQYKGHFRDCPVWIGGKEGKPWFVIPELIQSWINDVNSHIISEDEDIPKEEHVLYEAIHPFIDGNGRTGRIFLNWQRVRLGLPILVIWEKQKGAYYKWFL